jgi:hypothetical protein
MPDKCAESVGEQALSAETRMLWTHQAQHSCARAAVTTELGRKDSNLGMPGPKPGALPLGDAPM